MVRHMDSLTQRRILPDSYLISLGRKFTLLGKKVIIFETACKHQVYLINRFEDINMLVIPSDVVQIYEKHTKVRKNFYNLERDKILELEGNLEVYGGIGLKSVNDLFSNAHLKSLNLNNFYTDNVADFSHMFYNAGIEEVDISMLNTSNALTFKGMFKHAVIDDLKIGSIDTRKVNSMADMFRHSTINDEIDLSGLDTQALENTYGMFRGACIRDIKFGGFNTSNVTNMRSMFFKLTIGAETLDVSNFKTNKVERMDDMFKNLVTLRGEKPLDLRNFELSNVISTTGMLSEAHKDVLASDKLMKAIIKREPTCREIEV